MSAYIWYSSKSINKLASELMESSENVRYAQFQEDMESVYAEINADLTHGWLFKKTHPPVSTVSEAKEYFQWKKSLCKKKPFYWMDYCSGEWQFHRVAVANYHKRIDGDRAATSGLDVLPWSTVLEVDKVLISCNALSNLKARHSEVMELKRKFNIQ